MSGTLEVIFQMCADACARFVNCIRQEYNGMSPSKMNLVFFKDLCDLFQPLTFCSDAGRSSSIA